MYTILQDTSKAPLSQVPGMDAASLKCFAVRSGSTEYGLTILYFGFDRVFALVYLDFVFVFCF